MNELKINAEHELLALHKALMQAKFPETFDIHREIMGSPIISNIMNRLVNLLSETDSHSDKKMWEDWRKLEVQAYIYHEVCEDIISNKYYRKLNEKKKKEYVKNCFAPYNVNDEMVQQLIINADKQISKAESGNTPHIMMTCLDAEKNINDVNLHDATLESMSYDIYKKQLALVLGCREWESAYYTLKFGDVLYHEMTGCEFWGGGYNVLEWHKCGVSDIYSKLKQSEKIIPISFDDCFGVELLFNSGDKLKIVCRNIEVSTEKTEQ